jgi:hypothetical protein
MKRLWAVLALVGIAIGGITVGTLAACATGSPPQATGDTLGFSPGAPFVWESHADQVRDLDLMASTGAKWIRLDFSWPSVQPAPDTWNFKPFDDLVALVKSKGFEILALPAYTPDWAKAPGTTAPASPAAFAAFMTQLVTRYAPQGVKHWEIWNEPNLARFWSPPDPAAYTRLLVAGATAVHAADPGATVISAGLSPATDASDGSQISPLTFARGMYANGVKGSFDAFGIHPYGFPGLPTDTSTTSWNTWFRMADIHRLMDENGDGGKKIWMTEFGAPTGTSSGAVSEARQVDFVREALVARTKDEWLGPLFWYSARDQGTNPADREQNFGLWRNDFSAKPAAAAFSSSVERAVGIYTAFAVSR